MKEVQLGIKGEYTITVTYEDTAQFCDKNLPAVFSTPNLLKILEAASVFAVRDYYDEGEVSVGLTADFTHMAATPVGDTVVSKAELVSIEKNILTFNVEAFDSVRQIAKGTHKRALINLERFNKGLER